MSIKSTVFRSLTNLKSFSSYFKSNIDYGNKNLHQVLEKDYLYSIDEITAEDFHLESFIKKYDHTYTSCGTEVFNHWLHSIKTKEQVENIQQDMKYLASSSSVNFLETLLKKKVSKQISGNFIRDLWDGFSVKSWIVDHFTYLFLFNILFNLVGALLFKKYIALFIIFFCIINFALFILTNKLVAHITSSIGYFFSLCGTLKKIDKATELQLTIKMPDYKRFSKMQKYAVFFKKGIGGPSSGDLISLLIDYMRIFFAVELYSFTRVKKELINNIEELRNIYLYVGYVDCLLNSLHIMEDHSICFSKITENKDISFIDMKQPLVENSVPQTKKISTSLIITGLNMSGKTTFMKSLGLNQLLATSFGFCFAKKYETSVLDILSSITINDELLNGKSRYYAEAERLLLIKQKLNDHDCLCLIDEILSGTNSDDRIYGSTEILREFTKTSSLIIAATHDIQIANNLTNLYEPVYFDGEIQGNRIEFDYLIKSGIVSKKNGLLILKLLGI